MTRTFNWESICHQLEERLKETLPGRKAHMRMLPAFRQEETLYVSDNARESAVLILIYPSDNNVHMVMIQRSEDGGTHSGQIALPGGKRELSDEDIIATALREAKEEVNLSASDIEVIGQLSPLYISVSNFLVKPIVAITHQKPLLVKSDYEVNRIVYPNIDKLFASKRIEKINIPSRGEKFYWKAPVYLLEDETVVWGATAMILSEFEWIYDTIKK